MVGGGGDDDVDGIVEDISAQEKCYPCEFVTWPTVIFYFISAFIRFVWF